MDVNNPHLFDAEKDYMASKVPDLYEYPEDRIISGKYRNLWKVMLVDSIREVFGTHSIPKIATEEHIQQVKAILRSRIDLKVGSRVRPALMMEETEPAE